MSDWSAPDNNDDFTQVDAVDTAATGQTFTGDSSSGSPDTGFLGLGPTLDSIDSFVGSLGQFTTRVSQTSGAIARTAAKARKAVTNVQRAVQGKRTKAKLTKAQPAAQGSNTGLLVAFGAVALVLVTSGNE